MKYLYVLLPLIILSVLLAGCGDRGQEAAETPEPVVSGGEPTTVSVEHQPEDGLVEHEVRITEDGFFPATFNVGDGDTLSLVFLSDEAHFVVIEELGLAEEVQTTTLDLEFPGPGEYDMICLDCEDKPVAVINVQ